MNEAFGGEAETYAAEDRRRFVLDWPERTQSEPGQARLRVVQ